MGALLPAGRNVLPEEIEGGVCKAVRDLMLNHSLHHNHLKLKEFIETIDAAKWPTADARLLRNANTPEEWQARDLRS